MPHHGSKVHTPAGPATVLSVNCLKEIVTVEMPDKQHKTFPLAEISHTLLDKMGL